MIRDISTQEIIKVVRNLCIDANYNLGDDVLLAFKEALEREDSGGNQPGGKAGIYGRIFKKIRMPSLYQKKHR
jgi:tartrate dehydratase alpha subunit/fumarate hydratase class I-like protein